MWVTYKRKSQAYQTVFELSEKDYEKLSSPNINAELRNIRLSLKAIEKDAGTHVDAMDSFSFYEFEKGFILNNASFKEKKLKIASADEKNEFDHSPYQQRFKIFDETHPAPDSISATFLKFVRKKIRIGKVTTAIHYQTSYYSFKSFRGNVSFKDISRIIVANIYYWMTKDKGNSKTTASIYLRCLRAIYNEAIEDNLAKKASYPFGNRRFSIPAGRNTKKALTEQDIEAIYYYETDCPKKLRARDMWLFMYFGNGMNPKDVALLKYKNIDRDYLTFDRAKVEDTSESQLKRVTFYLTGNLKEIITKWANPNTVLETYLFPILEPGLDPLKESFKIDYFVATTNKWMRQVFSDLNLGKKSNTIVERHSLAIHLKRLGARNISRNHWGMSA
ncbi:MAG TPA: site-specific integrase [Chitinophagaceae bacterium]|nr:site-specific integrase [Chitinophagaceae bacterium]